jgi:cell division protein FtsB
MRFLDVLAFQESYRRMLARFRPYLPTITLLGLIVYFVFHGLTGELGWLLSNQRRAEQTQLHEKLKLTRQERMDLEARARLLRDGSLSRDLLEERARSVLGFADPRDYVIRLQP